MILSLSFLTSDVTKECIDNDNSFLLVIKRKEEIEQ
jgi:hypothetical protein